MKLNVSLMKLIIKLLIILILIVMLIIIGLFLYSAKYWPDVYTYINANITITHIPKISEIEIPTDITTENYDFTTNLYETTDISVTDVFEDDYFNFDDVENGRRKRERRDKGSVRIVDPKDYSEVPNDGRVIDYYFNIDETRTDRMYDSVDESRLTTADMNDVEIVPGMVLKRGGYLRNIDRCTTTKRTPQIVMPWVATIFIKNDTSSQFDYHCDGALISDTVVITAARCLQYYGTWATSDNVLVLLGKTSLQSMNDNEKVFKVEKYVLHENYTADGSKNDIAVIVLDEPVAFNEGIQPACLGFDDYEESLTTGWAFSGELTPISLHIDDEINCKVPDGDNTYCAVYGFDVGVCPSYGGIHVARRADTWHLHGIRHAARIEQNICYDNTIVFTDLNYYIDWIIRYIK